MGSFSWLRADRLTKTANIYYRCPFKFLIPEEFGGGFIKDHYRDYGYLGTEPNGETKYDMYELLAFWNSDQTTGYDVNPISEELKWAGKENGAPMPLLKEIDEFTVDNRSYGIDLGCYDGHIKKLKYPLKLVSVKNKQTYEECKGISLRDPDQGFWKVTWEYIDKTNAKRINKYEENIKREVAENVELTKKALLSTSAFEENEEFNKMMEEYAEKKEKSIRSRYE
jgi:hypothetical protein